MIDDKAGLKGYDRPAARPHNRASENYFPAIYRLDRIKQNAAPASKQLTEKRRMSMTLKALFIGACISAGVAAFVPPATAAGVQECVAGTPTPASYTWDFKGETNGIFRKIQSDARQAYDHAEQLQTLARVDFDWYTQEGELAAIKDDVNDIESKICRLETIRRVDAPWQKAEIGRIAETARLMVDNTQDAILFGNDHQEMLWLATYKKYADNLYTEAGNLAHSVDNAVAYPRVSKEYRKLQHDLRTPANS
jgi:hypothetical protein